MGSTVKYTADELEKKCNEYFEMKEKKRKDENKKLMYTSLFDLCSFLDITTQTWRNYRNRSTHFGVIKKAEERINANWVEQLFYPGRNASGAMFYLKNNAGYADRIEHQHSGQVEHNHRPQLDNISQDKLEKLNAALEEIEADNEVIDVTPEEKQDN